MTHRAVSVAVALAAAAALVACSSSAPPAGPSTTTMTLSMGVTVAPGTEVHRCRLVKVGDAFGGFVRSMDHAYTPGSHHVVLFRTSLTDVPPGEDGDVDCYAPGREMMAHARGVLYASQVPTGETKLPDGVGVPIKSGDVLLLQAHYLNPGSAPVDAKVDVHLTIAPPTATLDAAGVVFFYDPFIAVPAGGRASALLRCPIPKDIHLLGGVSHMHRRGVGFEAFVDAPSGELATAPFYTSNDWDHPQPLASTIDVPAGSKLRFRCDYDNAGAAAEVVQGQSADTDEMCVFTGLYYPAMTQAEDLCMGGADMFGAGTKTCSDTFACVQKCPPGSAPKLSTANVDVDPCWQRCFADSCGTAGGLVRTLLTCIRSKCGAACGDATSTACSGCVLSSCGDAYGACNAQACP